MPQVSAFGPTPFKVAMIVCGVLFVFLTGFAIGMKVGFHKALFSFQWGRHYEKNFLDRTDGRLDSQGPRGDERRGPQGMMGMMEGGRGMRNAHGIAGEVVSVADSTLVIKNPDNQENTIQINDGTIINRGPDTIALKDVVVGSRVVVLGKPQSDGVVVAHLIRVFSQAVLQP